MRYYERNKKAPENKITRMLDYIPALHAMFPEIEQRILRKIVVRGFQRIHREMFNNREVFLKSSSQKFQLIIDKAYEKKVEECVQ
jgi:hypothetical protein